LAKYTFSQLEDLWTQAGGNAAYSAMAAAIAMAESGGDSDATNTNTNGTTDRGLWQVNSIHGSQSTNDPVANARAAVSISSNGTNWRPWCTAWTGPCSGEYQGESAPYKKFLSGDGSSGRDGVTAQNAGLLDDLTAPLNPQTWANVFLRPLAVWAAYSAIGAIGLAAMIGGCVILTMQSKGVKGVIGLGAKVAGKVN